MGSDYEQFVCHGKATFFKDYDTAERILCEPDPGKQKQLARNVKNFDKMVWSANADNIMTTRLKHKFDQNPDLNKMLIATRSKKIAEMCASDKTWATGLDLYHSEAFNESKWTGKNQLGTSLMALRDSY